MLAPQVASDWDCGTVLIELRLHCGMLPGVNLMSLVKVSTVWVPVGVNPPV